MKELKMNWYAIRTQNNKERSVLEKLKSEIKYSNLEGKIGNTIIPTEKVISVKDGKKVFKEKIVYPGYLFIETNAVGEVTNILKTINGSSGFVRTKSGDVLPMKEYEVKKIFVEQEQSNNNDYNSVFVTNEDVTIIDGPFATFKGKIKSIESEKNRLKVEVSIFGRPTIVDLTTTQIQKA